ncbi:MAG: spore germination protein GerW family protein [Thermoleophilia bacterium]|nr:spore germination protein GerW family protein [Thermoleophilia bacterium]
MSVTYEESVSGAEGIKVDSFLERLADRLGGAARSAVIYGDPVDKAGVTVITVAKARWGLGGGSGGSAESGEGSGGGGGVAVSPVGYIEIRDGGSAFHPIRDPMALLALVLAGGFGALFLLRGVRKLVR